MPITTIFPLGAPSEATRREVLASLLTVSSLYPEKSRHVVLDANLTYYTAKMIDTKVWEVVPLKHAFQKE